MSSSRKKPRRIIAPPLAGLSVLLACGLVLPAPSAGAAGTAGAGVATAAGPGAPPPSELSIRGTGLLGTDYAMLGASVSAPLTRYLGLEAMAAVGGTFSDRGAGLLELLGRAGYYGQRHALTLGAGPSMLLASGHGGVLLLQTEVSYEYRLAGSMSFLAGVGPAVVLTDSASRPCSEGGLFGCGLFYREQYRTGDLSMRYRIGIGVAF